MAYPTQPMDPPGEPTNADTQPTGQPAPEASGPSLEATSQDPSSSLPPVDPALQATDTSLPPLDPSLPSIDSSLPPIETSLPAIDTSLPPLDTTLPAIDGSHTDGTEEPARSDTARPDNVAVAETNSNNDAAKQSGSYVPAAPGQGPNGMYHQHEQQPFQQQQQHPPPPQQPQAHSFHQQNPGMQHNGHTGAPPMSTGSVQTGGHVQGEHIPQAPIGAPLPNSMPPMGQYTAGYSPNIPQMEVNTNAQMRYQMPGDENRTLSSARHKKEVKRRTKTGCLTCRKRRIKVCIGAACCVVALSRPASAGRAGSSLASAPTKTPAIRFQLLALCFLPPQPNLFLSFGSFSPSFAG